MWADEDDDLITPRYESGVDAKGIKTVVETTINPKGQKIRTTTKVKVIPEEQRISRAVIERKKWKHFGAAAEVSDNHSYTITSVEQVVMENPKKANEVEDSSSNIAESLKKAMESVRTKNKLRQAGILGDGEAAPVDDEVAPAVKANDVGKYVPPGARFAFNTSVDPRQQLEDRTKIRVTNISQDTTEGDLRDLFERCGKVQRVYLAKDPETMQSRGFAFISFFNESDAENAMAKLQGFGYDHLILKLEWAKPSQRETAGPPGGGGLSNARVSGYGQALAQDSKQKVSYASNLTR